MAGNVEGGKKAAQTNKAKYGEDHYRKIGKLGGSTNRPETRWFSKNREAARAAGSIGGSISRRGKVKD